MHPPAYYQRNPGDVPSAVRNLLLSMKQLQDILKHWSVGQATETQVSDVYVQIGTDFNATVHAFAYHKIDLRFAFSCVLASNVKTDILRSVLFAIVVTSIRYPKIFAPSSSNVSLRIHPNKFSPSSCHKFARSCINCYGLCRHDRMRGGQ